MAEIDNVLASGDLALQLAERTTREREAFIREWIRGWLWAWYDLHRDDEVITIRVLIFKKVIRVEHFRPMIERLIGPHPGSGR